MDTEGEEHVDVERESRARVLGRRALIVGGAATFGATVAAPNLFAGSIGSGASATRRAQRAAVPPPVRRWSQEEFARTTRDRPMVVWRGIVPDATHRVLVVSGIHGYERITHPLAVAMLSVEVPAPVDCFVVPSANPDAWFAASRRNSRGVDLNRNFPWRWRSSTGGPGPGSEAETRALMDLVTAVRPSLTIWIHQPLGYVAAIGTTPVEYARPWANAAGLPVRVGMDQHGGGETWSNRIAGVPSLLVEVETWGSGQALIDRHVAGWRAQLDWLAASAPS